ncbi:MAG: hypothetical protein NT072_01660 [Deltaproteobacteria bacterium]|nr:hypothetical protein [Deltaproteobacteria bacterium]
MKVHKRIRLFAGMVMIVSLILTGCAANRSATAPAAPAAGVPEAAYVKDVTFDKADGKERVLILVSEMPEYTVSRESDTALTLKLKNVFVPDNLKKKLGEGRLVNIRHVALSQDPAEGALWAYVTVTLNEMAPYRISQEDKSIVLTCDVSSLSVAAAASDPGVLQARKLAESIIGDKEAAVQPSGPIKYTGAKVSLNFQDANIKSVFRSLSEVSGYNVIAGPGVDQKVTVFMKDVPWDQALDTILEINALGKKTANNVITVLPLADLQKAEEAQQKKDVSQGKLRQISIEAKIVEVNTTATRQLGIQWGYGYQNTWGGRDYGMLAGTAASGALTTLPGNIGLTGSNVAVNFPALVPGTGTPVNPGIGLIVGADKFILDAKLSALELSGDGKVISSPKVTTLDNVLATIKQGQQIPYTITDKDGNRTIEFKDAALLLEVKPTVTPEGQISLMLKATNDTADWANTNTNKENPPINTNSVESTVLVYDGDTLVVGGVYKLDDQEIMEGIPGLSEIPVMGWLFKTKTTIKVKRELLIFVTPRIIEAAQKRI